MTVFIVYAPQLFSACLKSAFRPMWGTVCERFAPNEGGVASRGGHSPARMTENPGRNRWDRI